VDPSYNRTVNACNAILERTEAAYLRQLRARRIPLIICGSLLAGAGALAIMEIPSSSLADLKLTLRTVLIGAAGLVYTFGSDLLRPPTSLRTASDLGERKA